MRRIVLVFVALTFLGFESLAQFEIRPLAGFNFANTDAPEGVDAAAKVGYQFGGHVLIGSKFHLYPGITYYQQVTEYVFDAGGDNEDVTVDQTVAGVKVPILVGYRFTDPEEAGLFNLRLFAGPTMLFHTKTEYSEGFVDDQVEWKDLSWAGRVGVGVDIAFLFVDLGYQFGLTDVHDFKEGVDSFTDRKHNTFIASVGVKIAL